MIDELLIHVWKGIRKEKKDEKERERQKMKEENEEKRIMTLIPLFAMI